MTIYIVFNFWISFKENPTLFERSEIVALFNTFNRLSESLHAIQKFRELYVQDQKAPEMLYPSVFKTIISYSRAGLSRVLNELEKRNIPIPVFIKSFV